MPLPRRHLLLALFAPLTACALGVASHSAAQTANVDQAMRSLADMLSRVVAQAVPPTYEKQEDWGATAEVPVGVRIHGKPFHYHYEKRTKTVDHGLWKHYTLRILEPARDLKVDVTELTPLAGGRTGFTIVVDARLDCWARAKAYQYGVHLGAYELEADCRARIAIRGDVGLTIGAGENGPTFSLDPRVADAKLELNELNIRRISNADGPIARALGDALRHAIEDELSGERLTAKLNRAIDKKRDRLKYQLPTYPLGAAAR